MLVSYVILSIVGYGHTCMEWHLNTRSRSFRSFVYSWDSRVGLIKVTSLVGVQARLGPFECYMVEPDCSITMMMIGIVRFTMLLRHIHLSHHIFHQWVNKRDLHSFMSSMRHWQFLTLHLELRLGLALSMFLVVLDIAYRGCRQSRV